MTIGRYTRGLPKAASVRVELSHLPRSLPRTPGFYPVEQMVLGVEARPACLLWLIRYSTSSSTAALRLPNAVASLRWNTSSSRGPLPQP